MQTYQTLHEADGSNVSVVDFSPSAEAFQSFMAGPAGEGMKANGIPAPDDVKFTAALCG